MIINNNKNVDKIEVIEPSLTEHLVGIMTENKDAGIIIASYIGTSIIIYVLGKSIAEIIIAFRNSDK
ncbi:MAG: hypothetical protein WBM86_19125 [Waterburya sp.]